MLTIPATTSDVGELQSSDRACGIAKNIQYLLKIISYLRFLAHQESAI